MLNAQNRKVDTFTELFVLVRDAERVAQQQREELMRYLSAPSCPIFALRHDGETKSMDASTPPITIHSSDIDRLMHECDADVMAYIEQMERTGRRVDGMKELIQEVKSMHLEYTRQRLAVSGGERTSMRGFHVAVSFANDLLRLVTHVLPHTFTCFQRANQIASDAERQQIIQWLSAPQCVLFSDTADPDDIHVKKADLDRLIGMRA